MAAPRGRDQTSPMHGSPGHAAAAPLVSLLACLGAMAAPAQARAVNHPPTGALSFAPQAPKTGDVVPFASNAADRDGDAVTVSWDVDDDVRWESTGATAI